MTHRGARGGSPRARGRPQSPLAAVTQRRVQSPCRVTWGRGIEREGRWQGGRPGGPDPTLLHWCSSWAGRGTAGQSPPGAIHRGVSFWCQMYKRVRSSVRVLHCRGGQGGLGERSGVLPLAAQTSGQPPRMSTRGLVLRGRDCQRLHVGEVMHVRR